MIEAFKQASRNRHFELQAARLHREGKIKVPLYLSLGTEHVAPCVLEGVHGSESGQKTAVGDPEPACRSPWPIFTQHRCHSWWLSAGGDPFSLMRELLGREDGCNGGMGGSASISLGGGNGSSYLFGPRDRGRYDGAVAASLVYGHDGLLGSNAAVAVGFAQATQRPVICVLGDAAVEEDYVLAALGHAATVRAPVLFIVEDNGLSIKTETKVRRSWDIVKVADSFGIWSMHLDDEPEWVVNAAKKSLQGLPMLLNIRCRRLCSHAGSDHDIDCKERYMDWKIALVDSGSVDADEEAFMEMQQVAEKATMEVATCC